MSAFEVREAGGQSYSLYRTGREQSNVTQIHLITNTFNSKKFKSAFEV